MAGIFLNFSQACQNKMFSALTSDFKKACGERPVYSVWTYMAQSERSLGNDNAWIILELVKNYNILAVKWPTPQGSSNSFSNETAQLSTPVAGLASPPGVPGRLELLPPQPRADMFNSTTHPGTYTPIYQHRKAWPRTRLNQILSFVVYRHVSVCR